jgi:hypothetical protein
MRSSLAAGLICLLGVCSTVAPARALQFDRTPVSATEVIVGGRGPIVKGDTARLQQALAAVPQGKRVVALALDSPGGNVVEGEQLAHLIRARLLPVVIPSNSQCVSACFLLFAASLHRMAASDALVGVHSANEGGQETDTSLAVTTLMARVAGEMGIPSAIVGKMVETAPGRVTWLTPEELESMDVIVYDSDIVTAVHQAATAIATRIAPDQPSALPPRPNPVPSLPNPPLAMIPPPQPVAPQAMTLPPPASLQPGLAAGRDDRLVWNAWFSGLRGDYRDGAAAALNQLGQPQRGACYGPNGVNRGDFTLGCEIAQQRLAAVAVRLRANANYAAGWNGSGMARPVGAVGPTEAAYQGAYFCGPQMARLTLTLFPPSANPRRRAVFSFGPLATSPNVPRGAFIVEGSFDPHGGVLSLAPVKWVTQPAGYNWLGLTGRSDDGGKTFSGRVVDSTNLCTTFTLARIADASAQK